MHTKYIAIFLLLHCDIFRLLLQWRVALLWSSQPLLLLGTTFHLVNDMVRWLEGRWNEEQGDGGMVQRGPPQSVCWLRVACVLCLVVL
jgi:hypothetical protein